jgi:hypothetical protein
MLHVIVFPPKVNLCFLFLLCFYFCFAKGLAKYKFGGIRRVPNGAYLGP